jgi:hypothetical protein
MPAHNAQAPQTPSTSVERESGCFFCCRLLNFVCERPTMSSASASPGLSLSPKTINYKPSIHDWSTSIGLAKLAGLATIKMTESPLKNILLMYRSLLMAMPRVLALPPLLDSVHISFTSSSTLCVNDDDDE